MGEWFGENIREPALDLFTQILVWLHDLVDPVVGDHAWGWSIILLTIIVRVFLLPLAIKQTRSMRAMQKLQPQLKELQNKYKVDRSLLKKDPEQYKAKKQKLNEEMMALYQREGANPAASCLPLLAQAPIFITLFWTLRRAGQEGNEIAGAPFYFFTQFGEGGLEQTVSSSGWPGILLIALMSGTMFLTQKQMMARNPAQAEGPMAQQQKIMLYAMPAFLAVVSFNFPMGILLYWVTTNLWQVAQQGIIMREVKHEFEEERREAEPGRSRSATSGANGEGSSEAGDGKSKGKTTAKGSGAPDSNGKKAGKGAKGKDAAGTSSKGSGASSPNGPGRKGSKGSASKGGGSGAKKNDHIPRRGGR